MQSDILKQLDLHVSLGYIYSKIAFYCAYVGYFKILTSLDYQRCRRHK